MGRRRDRSTHLRRNSNVAANTINGVQEQDRTAIKAEVEKLLKSAGLECTFNQNPPAKSNAATPQLIIKQNNLTAETTTGGNEYYEKIPTLTYDLLKQSSSSSVGGRAANNQPAMHSYHILRQWQEQSQQSSNNSKNFGGRRSAAAYHNNNSNNKQKKKNSYDNFGQIFDNEHQLQVQQVHHQLSQNCSASQSSFAASSTDSVTQANLAGAIAMADLVISRHQQENLRVVNLEEKDDHPSVPDPRENGNTSQGRVKTGYQVTQTENNDNYEAQDIGDVNADEEFHNHQSRRSMRQAQNKSNARISVKRSRSLKRSGRNSSGLQSKRAIGGSNRIHHNPHAAPVIAAARVIESVYTLEDNIDDDSCCLDLVGGRGGGGSSTAIQHSSSSFSDFEPASRALKKSNKAFMSSKRVMINDHYPPRHMAASKTLTASQRSSCNQNKPTSTKKIAKSQNNTIEQQNNRKREYHQYQQSRQQQQPMDSSALNQMVINLFQVDTVCSQTPDVQENQQHQLRSSLLESNMTQNQQVKQKKQPKTEKKPPTKIQQKQQSNIATFIDENKNQYDILLAAANNDKKQKQFHGAISTTSGSNSGKLIPSDHIQKSQKQKKDQKESFNKLLHPQSQIRADIAVSDGKAQPQHHSSQLTAGAGSSKRSSHQKITSAVSRDKVSQKTKQQRSHHNRQHLIKAESDEQQRRTADFNKGRESATSGQQDLQGSDTMLREPSVGRQTSQNIYEESNNSRQQPKQQAQQQQQQPTFMSDNIINIQIPIISSGTSKSKRTLRKLQNLISHISKGSSSGAMQNDHTDSGKKMTSGNQQQLQQYSLRTTFSGGNKQLQSSSTSANRSKFQQRNSVGQQQLMQNNGMCTTDYSAGPISSSQRASNNVSSNLMILNRPQQQQQQQNLQGSPASKAVAAAGDSSLLQMKLLDSTMKNSSGNINLENPQSVLIAAASAAKNNMKTAKSRDPSQDQTQQIQQQQSNNFKKSQLQSASTTT